ncbi:hypothetical protein ASF61_03475 [Duganella sp. Leaf126]|uniref:BatA domain-containing protein n=1 Tax=Duganella sp. Leaf126 TaxID=1736266 RepID=UPI0006F5CCE6|nr:BatA domain-containing protein [Duganella sp. Leaf126]KQQ47698.1 hypothetical protein ASF61_03475 [Duganella sp. Leaf126]
MTSLYPWWWLALPVLLLPIWWHRQKRQRIDARPLATARFLPAAAPEQLRVWQWRDRLLLLLRCLLLVALIALLAAVVFPWRGDTVLVDADADPAWTTRQIADAGMTGARRIALPPDALAWLRRHERDWRAHARVLILAREGRIAMPARAPQFDHAVELRVHAEPAAAAPAAGTLPATAHPAVAASAGAVAMPTAIPATYPVVLAASSARAPAWRALFTAFDQGGGGKRRYLLANAPRPDTALIVWDGASAPDARAASVDSASAPAPPAAWRAPHWWLAGFSGGGSDERWPEMAHAAAITVNGIAFRYADSPRGRLWTSPAFPPQDAATARALFEAWRLLDPAPAPAYPAPSHRFAAAPVATVLPDAGPTHWIALLVMGLFLLERIMTHVRRV